MLMYGGVRWWINAITKVTRGVVSNLSRGELNFFHIGGGGHSTVGRQKTLKSIDFTDPGGYEPPLTRPLKPTKRF